VVLIHVTGNGSRYYLITFVIAAAVTGVAATTNLNTKAAPLSNTTEMLFVFTFDREEIEMMISHLHSSARVDSFDLR
jgi:hypothetical protein